MRQLFYSDTQHIDFAIKRIYRRKKLNKTQVFKPNQVNLDYSDLKGNTLFL